ncbi:membrane protein FxsA [Mycobacterium mantenii]|uniref:Membrane protein FxsA n=1 Tax=Mycobacterium mantenii TaxID=560555 RepID=A0A1X0G5F9_MYCNT|nr:FxsA family protein [Mycobacterium mantenii]MCV7242265.1 membrane protein FxsA [Mycobacterium mantenii]ORB09075.1 membrane protein FxsA [Mycobacterium mantenii]BBY37395.1 membrane protein FxsA [Mycobacterium mantenii]
MVSRLLLIYALVELAVIFALVSTIGWGWTLLALLATFLLGWGIVAPMAGSRLIRRIGQLRSGLAEQRAAAGDGALVSLAALLVLVPGLVSTALGLLLLIPPVRSAVRPGLTSMAVRTLQRQMPGLSYASAFRAESYPASYPGGSTAGHGDYIDGEVIDVRDVEAPVRPPRFDGR